jgi:hypothetical protein
MLPLRRTQKVAIGRNPRQDRPESELARRSPRFYGFPSIEFRSVTLTGAVLMAPMPAATGQPLAAGLEEMSGRAGILVRGPRTGSTARVIMPLMERRYGHGHERARKRLFPASAQ